MYTRACNRQFMLYVKKTFGEIMADLQTQFEKFHDQIKLTDEKKLLREKRDILKNNLEEGFKKIDEAPKIDTYLLQGSYAIHTGIKPANDDYDIDVGVVFDCSREDIGALKLKNMVKNALDHPSRDPKLKNPCITIQYSQNGENTYHVDMPVYVKRDDEEGYDLAWGKSSSSEKWVQSDPKGLVDAINERYTDDEERSQFRRVVKYLKAWKGNKFSFNVPSIGLTLTAWDMFSSDIDPFDNSRNDLSALKKTVSRIHSSFRWIGTDNGMSDLYRLEAPLPVVPRNDAFEKLTDKQMTELWTEMGYLLSALSEAEREERIDSACKELGKYFLNFPVPTSQGTAKAAIFSLNNTGASS
ncbi:MAG: nucleotidyltransferase [Candidatus Electrothrix sp. AX5]|nr:nucleotidyltransferase [Candidatus Electrothrix sp. AX5]